MRKHFDTYGMFYFVTLLTILIGLLMNDSFWNWITK
jgi:hypothetical protein